MAVFGQVDPAFKQLNETREALALQLRRAVKRDDVPHIVEALDRYIEAKIIASRSGY